MIHNIQNTHFLDLSTVYGSEECEAASVRSFVQGKLISNVFFGQELPPQKRNVRAVYYLHTYISRCKHFKDTNCQSKDPFFCFTTGDFRNSLHPGLIPLHTIYIKEHNRIAAQFYQHNPSWTDEQIFQVSRSSERAYFFLNLNRIHFRRPDV